jgi:DNA (cytosine-5)-methyltransferase 1
MDLGLERAGMKVVYHSEIDPYACRVLRKHWPDVPNLGDIKLIKWKELDHVDVIAGGYPCQPFSNAGKRKGKEDPRHLWPYVFDAIREIRPRYALMENVRGHLTLGFGDVLADLASCGYSAEWQIIPASSVGAPHRRDRLFFVAYPDGERSHRTEIYADEAGKSSLSNAPGCGQTMADSDDPRGRASERSLERERSSSLVNRDDSLDGLSGRGAVLAHSDGGRLEERKSETESAEVFSVRSESGRAVTDIGGHSWQTEPDVGRVAHGIPARVDRLRGLGNAVVPQVAEFVGRKIMEFESLK